MCITFWEMLPGKKPRIPKASFNDSRFRKNQLFKMFDFQKVLHIRKIQGRTDMVFRKCITYLEKAVDTGAVFPEGKSDIIP